MSGLLGTLLPTSLIRVATATINTSALGEEKADRELALTILHVVLYTFSLLTHIHTYTLKVRMGISTLLISSSKLRHQVTELERNRSKIPMQL